MHVNREFNNNLREIRIIFPSMAPNASRIGFSCLKIDCPDLKVPGKINPEAVPIIKEFVKALNKVSLLDMTIIIIFVWVPLILLSIIPSIYSIKANKSFHGYLFFILAVEIILFFCFINKYRKKIHRHMTRTVENYRSKLRRFYAIHETIENGYCLRIKGRQPVIHIIPRQGMRYQPIRVERIQETQNNPIERQGSQHYIPIRLPIPMTHRNLLQDPYKFADSKNNPLKTVYTLNHAKKEKYV